MRLLLHPQPEKVRTQRELQNTFFTKWVPYDSWFADSNASRNRVAASSRWSSRRPSGQRRQLIHISFYITVPVKLTGLFFA